MRSRQCGHAAALAAALALLVGCEAVDGARARFGNSDPPPGTGGDGMALGLQAPGTLRAGDEGTLRISLTNNTDTVVTRARLELFVPGWAEPMPPRPGDPEFSVAATDDGGIRFSYDLGGVPLEPRQSLTVDQRIRVPAAGLGDGTMPWSRTVRARLVGPTGQSLAEVESEVGLDGAPPMGQPATPGAGGGRAGMDRLGTIRLGMTRAEVRGASPQARDTTWSQEGMTQQGMIVPLSDSGRALAAFDGDSIVRIEVADPSVRTGEGLGVGSTFQELRAAYGAPCAEAAEGRVVVWFENAPGISFALDTQVPPNVEELRREPDGAIPPGARASRWWVRRGVDSCPR